MSRPDRRGKEDRRKPRQCLMDIELPESFLLLAEFRACCPVLIVLDLELSPMDGRNLFVVLAGRFESGGKDAPPPYSS